MSETGEGTETSQVLDAEWVAFPGDELEARRPRARCAACREAGETGERPRRLCFQCYRLEFERHRAIGEVLSRVVSPFEGAEAARGPVGIVRHFHVPPTPADGDPRYAALAKRRRQAQLAARRALAEPVIDLEQFPVAWRPFVRIVINA